MGTLLAHLDGVTVRRGTREVLRGIDLDLPTGTVLALLGPGGRGDGDGGDGHGRLLPAAAS